MQDSQDQLAATSVVALLMRRAATMPDKPAFGVLPDTGTLASARTLTFAKTYEQARQVAGQLAAAGLVQGDRALLCFPQGLAFITAFYGCLYAGVIPVPTSSPRRRERISRWAAIAADAQASAVICSEQVAGQFDFGIGCIIPGAQAPALPQPVQTRPDDIAFLQYTSGSTSTPKGVIVTHGMLSANLAQIATRFAASAADHYLTWLPQFHDMGLISGVLMPVAVAAQATMISPASFLRDPLAFLKLVGATRATMIGGPDFAYDRMAKAAAIKGVEDIDLSSLRVAFTGAEPIRAETLTQFETAFAACGFRRQAWVGCYGLAEATVAVTSDCPGDGPRVQTDLDPARPLVGSGRPVDGMELAIVAANGRETTEVGEIWIRGPNVARGYWNQREEQAADPQFNLPLRGQSGWHRTGDLGALADGVLFVTGRIRETIIERGRTIYPQDVEQTATAADLALTTGRAAAVALPDGMALICEMTRQGLRHANKAALTQKLRAAVAQTHGLTPRRIVLLRPGQLPVTPSGKIQRLACARALGDGGFDPVHDWSAPQGRITVPDDLAARLRAMPAPLRPGAMRQALREMLRQLLGKDSPLPEDQGFFDLGLDSVAGLDLTQALESGLGVRLDQTALYAHPTLETLARYLVEQMTASEAPQASGQAGDFETLEMLLDADP